MTKSAAKVVGVLERAGGFASAQELHQLMSSQGERIGLTSVYRALQELLKENAVDLLHRHDGEAIYRICGDGHHHHLVCKDCGRTVEISGAAIEKWATSVSNEHGFRNVDHSVELFGICSQCYGKELERK